MDKLHDLHIEEQEAVEYLKALLRDGVDWESMRRGKHEILSQDGQKVTVTVTEKVDAEELIKLVPEVLQVGHLKYSINQPEVKRLLAAEIISDEDIEECTYRDTPRISVQTLNLDDMEDE